MHTGQVTMGATLEPSASPHGQSTVLIVVVVLVVVPVKRKIIFSIFGILLCAELCLIVVRQRVSKGRKTRVEP